MASIPEFVMSKNTKVDKDKIFKTISFEAVDFEQRNYLSSRTNYNIEIKGYVNTRINPDEIKDAITYHFNSPELETKRFQYKFIKSKNITEFCYESATNNYVGSSEKINSKEYEIYLNNKISNLISLL